MRGSPSGDGGGRRCVKGLGVVAGARPVATSAVALWVVLHRIFDFLDGRARSPTCFAGRRVEKRFQVGEGDCRGTGVEADDDAGMHGYRPPSNW